MSHFLIPIEAAKLSWREDLPFSKSFNDIYFSKENGLEEVRHVFIEGNRLIERWQNLTSESFVIGETGFGTGLNFLLTWALWLEKAPPSARLYYFSCDKFPLKKNDLQRCLNQWPQLKIQARAFIEDYPTLTPGFHYLPFNDGRINLVLMLGEAIASFKELLVCGDAKLEQRVRTTAVDAWFLDGFAPAKNPAMWSLELLQVIGLLSKPGTTLATFSAASSMRAHLQAAGFNVQKIKGFGTKREMVIAHWKAPHLSLQKLRSTPWHVASEKPSRASKKVIILGAGLAGCYTAYALAKRGWQVLLIDERREVGCGASGNEKAILYPKFSAYRSPLTVFMLTAFLFASREYRQLLKLKPIGELSGLLQLAFSAEEAQAQLHLRS